MSDYTLINFQEGISSVGPANLNHMDAGIDTAHSELAAHVALVNNPHSVTLAQVGGAPSAHVGATGAAHGDATGSVAGFMPAAAVTKLASIESGATADMTAAELLAAVKTVDGSGSGLDADYLRGYGVGDFAPKENIVASSVASWRGATYVPIGVVYKSDTEILVFYTGPTVTTIYVDSINPSTGVRTAKADLTGVPLTSITKAFITYDSSDSKVHLITFYSAATCTACYHTYNPATNVWSGLVGSTTLTPGSSMYSQSQVPWVTSSGEVAVPFWYSGASTVLFFTKAGVARWVTTYNQQKYMVYVYDKNVWMGQNTAGTWTGFVFDGTNPAAQAALGGFGALPVACAPTLVAGTKGALLMWPGTAAYQYSGLLGAGFYLAQNWIIVAYAAQGYPNYFDYRNKKFTSLVFNSSVGILISVCPFDVPISST